MSKSITKKEINEELKKIEEAESKKHQAIVDKQMERENFFIANLQYPDTIIEEMATKDLANIKPREIIKLDSKYEWCYLKQASRKYHKIEEAFKLIINKNTELVGKITNKEFECIQRIGVIKEVINTKEEDAEPKIFFFDEYVPRGHKIMDSYDVEFWVYKFKCEDRDYLILTEEELELEEYTLTGSLIYLNDYADVGKYSKLNLKIPLLLVHSKKKRIIEYKNHQEFFEKIKELGLDTENNIHKAIFTYKKLYWKNPKEFEDLILAWLFAAKKKDYPLHMMVIGDAGSGKSTLIETLHDKSGEIGAIFEGTTSTFKELIPSFKGMSPKVGYVIESNRFCFPDEFLRVLMRVDKDDRSGYLTFLNTLLEHKRRRMGSGNSGFVGKMTSKMFAVTNPVYGTSNIGSLVHKFQESITFLSRLLIFYQTREHNKFINEQKKEDYNMEKGIEIDTHDFLSIYDYLNSFEAEYDPKVLTQIFNKFREYLMYKGEDILIKDMFDARYYHHLSCLLDGIIKKRCIIEKDDTFKVIEKDYNTLREFVKLIFSSWGVTMIDKEEV